MIKHMDERTRLKNQGFRVFLWNISLNNSLFSRVEFDHKQHHIIICRWNLNLARSLFMPSAHMFWRAYFPIVMAVIPRQRDAKENQSSHFLEHSLRSEIDRVFFHRHHPSSPPPTTTDRLTSSSSLWISLLHLPFFFYITVCPQIDWFYLSIFSLSFLNVS